MKIVIDIVGLIIISIVYFLVLKWEDTVLSLNLKKKNGVICSKASIALYAATAAIWIYLSVMTDIQASVADALLTGVLLVGMSVVAITDYYKYTIQNKVLFILFLMWTAIAGLTILISINDGFVLLLKSIVGCGVAGAIFLLCYVLSHKQLGGGDVKLACIMGLYLNSDRVVGAILYGTIICCLYSIVRLIRKTITIRDGVPLAPFLYAGTLIALIIR